MTLAQIIQIEKTRYSKLLIPSNGGLDQVNSLAVLGVEMRTDDRYFDRESNIEVIRYRGEDIPAECAFYAERGIPAIGITGFDLLTDYRLGNPSDQIREIRSIDWTTGNEDYMFQKPTLCLIGVEGSSFNLFPADPLVVANRKYSNIARTYLKRLEERFGVKTSVRYLSGKTENEIPNMADYAIDIVYSGTTLKCLSRDTRVPRVPALAVLDVIMENYIAVITAWPKTAVNM